MKEERNLVVSAGKEIELVCAARGSRPAAKITWWRGQSQMTEIVQYRVSIIQKLKPFTFPITELVQFAAISCYHHLQDFVITRKRT